MRLLLWTKQNELGAAVFCPGGFVVPWIGRTIFTKADGVDPLSRNPKSSQILAHSQRAALPQRAIVLRRAPFVAMAFNLEHRPRFILQESSHCLDLAALRLFDGRFVEIEVHCLFTKHIPIWSKLVGIPASSKFKTTVRCFQARRFRLLSRR